MLSGHHVDSWCCRCSISVAAKAKSAPPQSCRNSIEYQVLGSALVRSPSSRMYMYDSFEAVALGRHN